MMVLTLFFVFGSVAAIGVVHVQKEFPFTRPVGAQKVYNLLRVLLLDVGALRAIALQGIRQEFW